MIATGGLLRINARRKDSVRSTTRKHKTHPKKKKRQRDIVVVKGKLRLCSMSGLVAGLGILILLLGALMAVLGYWPAGNMLFSSETTEGTLAPALDNTTCTNTSDNTSTASAQRGDSPEPIGVLEVFLNRYLYSDRLKVIGPLIMGGGIFLFICANAVLHETRDKKTKVIDLRDVYSTVVDLHGLQTSNPVNGLHGYVQSKPSPGLSSLPLAEQGGEGGDNDTVFSIDPIWFPNLNPTLDDGCITHPSPRPKPKPSFNCSPNLSTNIIHSCNPNTYIHPNPNTVCEPSLNPVASPLHSAPSPADGNPPGGSGGLQGGRPGYFSPLSKPQMVSSNIPEPIRTYSKEISCSSFSLLLLSSSSSSAPLLTPGQQSRRRSFPGGNMTGCTKVSAAMGSAGSTVPIKHGQDKSS